MTYEQPEDVRAFLKEKLYLQNVSPRTIILYEFSFRAFAGAISSLEVVKERVVELRERGNSPVTVNTYLRHIKCFYKWQGKEWKLPWLQEEQKILPTLSADAVRTIINFKPIRRNETRIWRLTLAALDTGLRIDELLGLTRQNVNLDSLTLRVKGKGNKERVVPMSVELRKILYRHLAGHQHSLVFCTQKGSKLTQRNALRDFKAVCSKLGITGVRCSFHTLRHSFAVGYLRRGGNLEFLRRILGHTSLSTTQKYLRSLGVEDLQAVHNELSLLAR